MLETGQHQLLAFGMHPHKKLLQGLDAGAIQIGRLLQTENHRMNRHFRMPDQMQGATKNPLDVGEKQRLTRPYDQHPWHRAGRGMTLQIDEIMAVTGTPEHLDVRHRQLLEHQQHTDRHRDQQAIQHPQRQHRHHRTDHQHTVALPDEVAPQGFQAQATAQRMHDDGRQDRFRGQGNIGQHGQDNDQHHQRRHTARQSRIGAGGFVGGGRGIPRSHGHAVKQPGHQVGGAQRQQVPIGRHPVTVLEGK
ncbi:hypothetical protein D3C84_332140 [compost metagenome]